MHINQMSLTTDIVSRTVKTQKLFNFQPGKCFYVNIQTSKRNQKNQNEPVIKIINTVCREAGSHLSKITEIRFKEKLILIEDLYTFKIQSQNGELSGDKNSSQPTKSSDGSNHSNPLHQETHKNWMPMNKKKLIFKKKYLEDNARLQKRNTKNIAKNFCKAFINYLEQKKNNSVLMKAKQLMSYYNYNNKTIQALGRDPLTKQHFQQFLKNRASQWVSSSKIFDKKIHQQAIPLYLSLVQSQNGFNYNEQINDSGIKENGPNGENIMINEDEGKSNSVYESDQLFEESPNDNSSKNEAA